MEARRPEMDINGQKNILYYKHIIIYIQSQEEKLKTLCIKDKHTTPYVWWTCGSRAYILYTVHSIKLLSKGNHCINQRFLLEIGTNVVCK